MSELFCTTCLDRLDEYLDAGPVPHGAERLEAQKIEAHFASCAPCALALKRAQAVRATLRQIPLEPAPAGLAANVSAAVANFATTSPPTRKIRAKPTWTYWSGGLLTVMAAGLLVWSRQSAPLEPEIPPPAAPTVETPHHTAPRAASSKAAPPALGPAKPLASTDVPALPDSGLKRSTDAVSLPHSSTLPPPVLPLGAKGSVALPRSAPSDAAPVASGAAPGPHSLTTRRERPLPGRHSQKSLESLSSGSLSDFAAGPLRTAARSASPSNQAVAGAQRGLLASHGTPLFAATVTLIAPDQRAGGTVMLPRAKLNFWQANHATESDASPNRPQLQAGLNGAYARSGEAPSQGETNQDAAPLSPVPAPLQGLAAASPPAAAPPPGAASLAAAGKANAADAAPAVNSTVRVNRVPPLEFLTPSFGGLPAPEIRSNGAAAQAQRGSSSEMATRAAVTTRGRAYSDLRGLLSEPESPSYRLHLRVVPVQTCAAARVRLVLRPGARLVQCPDGYVWSGACQAGVPIELDVAVAGGLSGPVQVTMEQNPGSGQSIEKETCRVELNAP